MSNHVIPRPPDGHPCYSASACHAARIHLPVAPRCNVSCIFCNRRYDCPNEGRPGVTSALLRPGNAVRYLRALEQHVNLDVVGIAGPGDPMANPDEVFETFSSVRAAYPDMAFCLATNGLELLPHIDRLLELGVGYVTITINAATSETGARVYRWIRWRRRVLRGPDAAAVMIGRQFEGVTRLADAGVQVKINTVLIPGTNDHEVEEIAQRSAAAGAAVMNVMPVLPVAGTPIADMAPPSWADTHFARRNAEAHLRQIGHCHRCRADAAGTLDDGLDGSVVAALLADSARSERHRVAVATREGVLVNQHLGEADRLLIFELDGGEVTLVDERRTPEPGCGAKRWQELSELIADCSHIAVSGIGGKPKEALEESGVEPVVVSCTVAEISGLLLRGEDHSHLAVRGFRCSGGAEGCA